MSIRNKNRVLNSARNIFTSAFMQTILGIVAFVERTFFLKYLSADYLGLNSLFANVLYVLSIAELGIGSAIAFALYKPLAEHDNERIAMYMAFFKKAYNIIGSIILVVGVVLSPFIKNFASDGAGIQDMSLYFLLYLFSVGICYFFSYKQILIEADQKKYICQSILCAGSVLQAILQIVVLILTHNYAIYLAVFFVCNVGKNIIISVIANRMYPVIKDRKHKDKKFNKDERKQISTNIRAMCYHKFGEIAIGSSDSILISYIVDLTSLGLYANYQIIIEALRSAMRVFYSSVLASIGNMCATEEEEDIYYAFKTLNFTNYILFSFVTVAMFCLIQPILSLWLGAKYLLSTRTVFLICMMFFLTGTRNMLLNFHDAYGLFWADKYKRIMEAVVNLGVSFALGKLWGLDGIFLGTIASNLTGFWIEGIVVYKYAFHRKPGEYIRLYGLQAFVTVLVMCITMGFCSIVSANLLIVLIYRILICIVVPICIYLVIYRKNRDFIAMRKNVVEMAGMLFKKNHSSAN